MWAKIAAMNESVDLQQMDEAHVRHFVMQLLGTVQSQSQLVSQQATELKYKQALIDKLTNEMAVLKRLKFAAKSEALAAH